MAKATKGTSGSGKRRDAHIKVKTAKGRKISSTLWLERQLNDPYVQQAKADGFRSRSAYKLKEIDDAHNLMSSGMGIIDLGAAPGGWSQYAAQKVKAMESDGFVVGMDLHTVDPIPGAILFKKDFTEEDAPSMILEAINNRPVHGVISDMAPHATGHRQTDHLQIMGLCEMALEFAFEILTPDSFFLAKTLQGGTETALLTQLKQNFTKVRHVKPPSSRADSREYFVLATGFKG